MRTLIRRLIYLLRRSQRDADLMEEIETHRSLRQAALERNGHSLKAAEHESRRLLGDVLLAREDVRDVWAGRLDALGRNLRHAVRSLWRRPAFAGLTIATLALTIGANLAVFTVVNALWLRRIAVPEPDRVAMVTAMHDQSGTTEGYYFGAAGLDRYLRGQPVVENVAGQVVTSGHNVGNRPQISLPNVGEVEALAVTQEYFAVMGLTVQGRDFQAVDDVPGADPVAILSHELWTSAFDRSDAVIGSVVPALPLPLRIVGIAPPGFRGARHGERNDLWVPRLLTSRVAAEGMGQADPGLLAYVRIREDVSFAEAERDLRTAHPRQVYQVIPVSQLFGSPDHRTLILNRDSVLWIALATAGLVLLAGCATLMALFLVQFERRRQELAIHLTLGCGRLALLGTLVAEMSVLALLGSLAAFGTAMLALSGMPALSLPGGIELGRLDLTTDWSVVGAGLLTVAVAMMAAVVLPLHRSTHPRLVTELIASSLASTSSSLRLRRVVLATHVASTLVVLIAGGLFVRTVAHGLGPGPGFDTERLLFIKTQLRPGFITWAQRQAESEEAREERLAAELAAVIAAIQAVPGVDSVVAGGPPLGLDAAAAVARPRILRVEQEEHALPIAFHYVDVNYSTVLGIPLLAGRPLVAGDVRRAAEGLWPVHVTRSAAEALWPDESPLGREFQITERYAFIVVGILGDIAFGAQRLGVRAGVLVPRNVDLAAQPMSIDLTVRTTGSPRGLEEAVRYAVLDIVPNAPRVDIRTAEQVLRADLGRERLGAWFFSGFGLVGLLLGVGGVFGLVAYAVEFRRREIGVRLALGATFGQVFRLVVIAGTVPVLVGALAGLLVGALLAQAIGSMLIGIGAFDAPTFLTAAGLMIGGGTAAAVIAASRTRRVSPTELLRTD